MLRTGVIWKSGWCITNRSGWLLELLTELIRHKRTKVRHLFNMCHSNSAGGLEHRAIREVIKNGCFTVRLIERRGGRGVSHLGPDRKQLWKFWFFFQLILILWYSKHISSHCEGYWRCIFMSLTLFARAYLSVSKDGGGHICRVRVKIARDKSARSTSSCFWCFLFSNVLMTCFEALKCPW